MQAVVCPFGHMAFRRTCLTFALLTRPFGRLLSRLSMHSLLGLSCGALLTVPAVAGAQSITGSTLAASTEWSSSDRLSATSLPEAPSALSAPEDKTSSSSEDETSSSLSFPFGVNVDWVEGVQNPTDSTPQRKGQKGEVELDANGNPIPIERQQPARILGFMPNFRSVSEGAVAHPPGWKYNFKVATRQAFDYSSFLFLGLTSISAEGLNEHPVLGKGVSGFYSYTWRGFLDKTDGTYLQAWLLPSLLHEDTRYYALGKGHKIVIRALYVISRQGVARTYGGRQTPNLAGLGGKVLTQVVSRNYYPTGATSFGVLAEKFGYAAMRDVAFTSIREFYPDIAAHYVQKHRTRALARSAADAAASQSQGSPPATKP